MEQLLNGMVCKSLSLDGLNAANKFAESFLDSLADGKVDLIFKMYVDFVNLYFKG